MYWRALHRHDDLWLGGKLAALIEMRPGLAATPLSDPLPDGADNRIGGEPDAAARGRAAVIKLPG
jgi:hypothetical protein